MSYDLIRENICLGCILVWGRREDRHPKGIKSVRENSSTNGNKPAQAISGPSHTWASKSSLELLDPRLNDPGADKEPIFSKFHVLHPFEVVAKIGVVGAKSVII